MKKRYIAFSRPSYIICSGEACWWTVHPASKQRSEGEKVRVGDDVIFVSVATERYLVGSASIHTFQPKSVEYIL